MDHFVRAVVARFLLRRKRRHRAQRRMRTKQFGRHTKRKSSRELTCSTFPPRADRSRIVTASRSRRTNLVTRSRLRIRRRSIFPTHRSLLSHRRKSRRRKSFLAGKLRISDELILRHYHNRGVLPFEIAQGLTASEKDDLKGVQGMVVRPIYLRSYPNGHLAGQVIGYTGKKGTHSLTASSKTMKHLWPETEGREGTRTDF